MLPRPYRQPVLFTALVLSLLTAPRYATADNGPLGFGSAVLTEDLESDRPDFTEGTQTIQKGHFQLEGGYTYYHDSDDQHVLPELLSRFGVADDIEIRLAWEGYVFSEPETQGATDFSLGYKQRIFNRQNSSLSYILEASLPAGSDNQSSGEVDPGAKLLGSYDLSERASLGGNLNLSWIYEDGERAVETAASLALGYGLSEELGTYAEYFGIYPENGLERRAEHYLNGGFTYLVTENLQLDIRAGMGLCSESTPFFSGVGFAWRL